MTDVSNWPVRAKQCKSCPFNLNTQGHYNDPVLTIKIQNQVLSEASQICHHEKLSGQQESYLCRGAKNYQLQIFHRMGFLKSPTDEAWQENTQKLNSLASQGEIY